jgi:endo-1,3-1,4-beta-glycanase ExoK
MWMVGRRWVSVIAVLAMLAIGVSVAGAARSSDFRDEFTSFEVRRWVKVDRPFGHGQIDSANVSVANGLLDLRLPAGRLDGAEVRSTGLYRYGTFRARMKVANAPSSLTAFFLYRKPDYAQEIDIEIFNDSTGRVMFSTYSGSAQTNNVIVDTEYDLSGGFHEYTIEYDPDSVRFLLDGTELMRFSTGVPRSAMYLFVNAWFPFWLAGEVPTTDRHTLVDWIEHTGR